MYMREKKDTTSKAGFTVIEMIVVMVILGILITVGMISFTSWQNRGKQESAVAVAEKVKLILDTYYSEKDRFPQAQTGATSVVSYLTSKGDTSAATEFGNTAKYTYTATTATGAACSDTGTNKCEKYVITVKKETWSGSSDITVKP